MEIYNPETKMLVTATCVGDMEAQITGYYYFDKQTNKHYICDSVYLKQHEIEPETIKFVNAI